MSAWSRFKRTRSVQKKLTASNSKSSQSRTKGQNVIGATCSLGRASGTACEHVSERCCRKSLSSRSACEKTWIKCYNKSGTMFSRWMKASRPPSRPHRGACLEMEQGSWKPQLSRRSGTVDRMDIPEHVFECFLLAAVGAGMTSGLLRTRSGQPSGQPLQQSR